MSARTFPTRGRLCLPIGQEGGAPAGAVRHIWLVGKRSKYSNRNILVASSFLAGSSSRFFPFHLADSLPWFSLNDEYLSGLRSTGQTRSCAERWLGRIRNASGRRGPHKLFACHDLPIAVGRRGLTGESPKRYIGVRRGRSRSGGLSKSPNGPVEGLSPEIVESAA